MIFNLDDYSDKKKLQSFSRKMDKLTKMKVIDTHYSELKESDQTLYDISKKFFLDKIVPYTDIRLGEEEYSYWVSISSKEYEKEFDKFYQAHFDRLGLSYDAFYYVPWFYNMSLLNFLPSHLKA